MLNALITDWSEYLEKPVTNESIKKDMRKVKIYFMVFFFITLLIVFGGLTMIVSSKNIDTKLTGLFIAIVGFVSNCLMKTWCHIQLAKYKILWEMNKRFEGNVIQELRRSEAQDL